MNLTSTLGACALALLLAGCGTTIELNKVPADPARTIALQDNRKAEEKVYRRDGVRTPVQYFGDEDFDAPPLSQFSQLLGARLPAGNYALHVDQFRVIDIYPQRLAATTAAGLTGALGGLGYSAFFTPEYSTTQDNITCLISGNLQSKDIRGSASVPYKISPFAGLVKNDPAFKSAANECLNLLSDKVAKAL